MFATPDDVERISGRQVTQADAAAATGVIEVYAGRTVDDRPHITPRDWGHLQRAAAWQAAWASQQPAVDARPAGRSTRAAGASARYDADPQGVLAPHAARALKQCSWFGNRVTAPASAGRIRGNAVTLFTNDAGDALHPWGRL